MAAPAMRRVADQALKYLGVSPRLAMKDNGRQEIAAKEKTVSVLPPAGEKKEEDGEPDELEQPLAPEQVLTPVLAGMTMKQAMESLAVSELRPLFMGTGFAMEQTPAPGEPVHRGSFVQVNFEPDGNNPDVEESAIEEHDDIKTNSSVAP